MRRNLAAADIGSNTVHLLIAETDGKMLQRHYNRTEWLSLGEAVARTGSIPPEKETMLLEVLRDYKIACEANRVQRFYVFATEAMRVAQNGQQVLDRIHRETGIEVDVISPRQEAEFSFKGVSLDCHLVMPMVLVEVGGGSAQIALCDGGEIRDEASLPLGTGKLIATANLVSPATDSSVQRATEYIHNALDRLPFLSSGTPAIASGGVVRGLWRALHPDGDRELSLEEIQYLAWATRRLSVNKIVQRFGVKPKRASALLAGSLVYAAIMERFEITSLIVSEYGVREGAILAMAQDKLD